MSKISPNKELFLLASLIVLVADVIIKSKVTEFTLNSGFSFGIGAELGNTLWILVYLILMTSAVVIYSHTNWDWRYHYLILILLGASNFLDRILIGGVKDYLYFGNVVFNISDVAINLYIFILIIYYGFYSSNRKQGEET